MNDKLIYNYIIGTKKLIAENYWGLNKCIKAIEALRKGHAPMAAQVAFTTVVCSANWNEEFGGEPSCMLPTTKLCMENWRSVRRDLNKNRKIETLLYAIVWDDPNHYHQEYKWYRIA